MSVRTSKILKGKEGPMACESRSFSTAFKRIRMVGG